MELTGKVCVVTGAASGIGKALCIALANEGAGHVVAVDRDAAGAEATAASLGGTARQVDVSEARQIEALVDEVEDTVGGIDLFVSNAGILSVGGPEVPDAEWQKIWEVNVMAHVWAARYVVPRMIARGGGHLLNTASAAGLLNQVGAAPYGVTKHAAVGLAEWLSLTYGDAGIGVSCLCPQAVRTEMTRGHEEGVAALDGMLEPEAAASACIDAIRENRFLVLPHPQVLDYMRLKAADYDRWLGGMRKLNRRFGGRAEG